MCSFFFCPKQGKCVKPTEIHQGLNKYTAQALVTVVNTTEVSKAYSVKQCHARVASYLIALFSLTIMQSSIFFSLASAKIN